MKKIYQVTVHATIINEGEKGGLERMDVLRDAIKEGVSLDWAGGLLGEISAKKITVEIVRVPAVEEITLSGFGDFSEDPAGYKDLKKAARTHGVKFYATYYDHELKGDAKKIEALTMDLWSMPRDQWSENALNEAPV